MDNSKFLKIVIVILLLINIGTLAFMWTNNHPHGHPPHGGGDAVEFLTHELKLNDAQQKQFEELRHQHHDAVEALQHQGRKLHDDYFNLIGNSTADSVIVSAAADSILALQKQIELITFYHFKSVRAICTPEQQRKFDEVISEALARMAPKLPHENGR